VTDLRPETLEDDLYAHLASGGVVTLTEREGLSGDARAALTVAGARLIEDRADLMAIKVALALMNPGAFMAVADGAEVEDLIVRDRLTKAVRAAAGAA